MRAHRALVLLLLFAGWIACSSPTAEVADAGGEAPVDAASGDIAEIDAQDVAADTAPSFEPWPVGPVVELDAPFYAEHAPAFSRMSHWATHVEAGDRPETRELGAFAVGNGHIFGLLAMTTPLNTLHGLVGPTYEKRDRFFGDYVIRLEGDDGPFYWDEEWAGQSLSAPVVVTRGVSGEIVLDTVSFAPWTELDANRCIIRFVIVTNGSAEPTGPLEVRLHTARATVPTDDGGMFEVLGERGLVTTFFDGDVTHDDRLLVASIGSIEPAGSYELAMAQCAQDGTEPQAVPTFDPAELLDQTGEVFRAWESQLVQVDLPDPMVADFLDGMKLTLKLQTTDQGASCPMSGYTRTWARDNIGPALGWLALGAHDEVAAMMDYIYGGVLLGGNLGNSYDADLDLSDLPDPPDWDAMGPLSGRVASETPSYMVWIYGAYYLATGDLERAEDRWGFLRRCTLDVGFEEERFLPYTGDETFRAAMNASFGLDLEFPHHERSFSLNSQLLWLGSARHFVTLADALGETADREAALEISAEMDSTVRSRYLLEDDCLSAFIDRQDMEPWPAPFEDEALKVTWAGWLGPDDPFAADSIQCLLDRVGVAPGVVQSPMHEIYAGMSVLDAQEGVYTGMLPGYTLSALTAIGHPEAEDAFHAMRLSAGTSGNFQEYMVYDDRHGFTVIYDATGIAQDYTAKYRPWEGGINLAAALQYLVGFEGDAPRQHLSLRPHLPEGWPGFSVHNLRVGDERFDVTVTATDSGAVIEVASRASTDYTVSLRYDGASGAELDGAPLSGDDLTVREHFGITSVSTGDLALEAGSGLSFEVRR